MIDLIVPGQYYPSGQSVMVVSKVIALRVQTLPGAHLIHSSTVEMPLMVEIVPSGQIVYTPSLQKYPTGQSYVPDVELDPVPHIYPS